MKQSDQYSPKETEQRLRALMRGAFAGPPTQMKNIPKKRDASKKRRDVGKPVNDNP